MASGEVTYSTHIIAALSDSRRAGGSGSMIENLTCPSGAAAGLNVALPPDDVEHNAARVEMRIQGEKCLCPLNSPSEPRLRAPRNRDREQEASRSKNERKQPFLRYLRLHLLHCTPQTYSCIKKSPRLNSPGASFTARPTTFNIVPRR